MSELRTGPLTILYVAMKYDYGVPEQGLSYEHCNFFDCLHRMGHRIVHFDFMQLMRQHGPIRMNQRLLEVVDQVRPDLLFSCLYQDQIDPATIRTISERGDVITYNWFCDDHWRFHGFTDIYAPYFHWCSTTALNALPKYARLGYRNVIRTQWACNPFNYRRLNLPLMHDVTFVGQAHGNRRQVIQAIRDAGITVETWGRGWDNGRLDQDRMIRVFNQSRVNLNLTNASVTRSRIFSHSSREQVKGRNFEVPGCGGFLLTGDAEDLRDFYCAGQEIVIANTPKEIVEKTQYYLSHEDERQSIADAGYRRTIAEHTYVHRFTSIFRTMGLAVPDPDRVLQYPPVPLPVDEVRISVHQPKVSVVLPIYNSEERYLRASVTSILEQTLADLELVLVNDGSTRPETLAVLEELRAHPRIRVIHQENQGKAGARGRGAREAHGEYVAIMDHDDIAFPDRLSTEVAYLDRHPAIDAVGSFGQTIDADGRPIGEIAHPTLPGSIRWAAICKNPVLNSSGMVRRSFGDRINWYRESPAEDHDFWCRAAWKGRIANIPRQLVQLRRWDGNFTSQASQALERASAVIAQEAASALLGAPVPPADAAALRLMVAGVSHMSAHDAQKAASLLHRLAAAYIRHTDLSGYERRFVRHSTAEWLCALAGRLRDRPGTLVITLLYASRFSLLWTVRSMVGFPRSLLRSEQDTALRIWASRVLRMIRLR